MRAQTVLTTDGVLRLMAKLTLLVLGPASTATALTLPGITIIKLELPGSAPGINFGQSVAGLGDVNGDGELDVIVGAPRTSPRAIPIAGTAFVYAGKTGRPLFEINGRRPYTGLGSAVASGGDVNGDGSPDLVIGAFSAFVEQASLLAGRAWIYSADHSLLFEVDGAEQAGCFGISVAGIGDADGDGFGDVAVGAFNEDVAGLVDIGKAYVYSGQTGSLMSELLGTQFMESFGWSVAGPGDIDGDGRPDVIVGAPFGPTAGAAYVYSPVTGTRLFQITGNTLNAKQLGQAVAGAGDVDADGVDDVLLGAPGTNVGGKLSAGAVYVYSVAKSQVLLTMVGEKGGEHFGEAVASAGDVDGDGVPDIVVGARGKLEAGIVRVHSGSTGAKLLELIGNPGDHLGASVASAGDVDGDGRSDVIVGAPFADPNGLADTGVAMIIGL